MPPKPWQTRPKNNPIPDISKVIQTTAPKQDLPTIPLKQGALINQTANTSQSTTKTEGLNSLMNNNSYSSFGSGLGGYGGFGSSMYGGGMGGMMGGYGMGGMYGMNNQQPGFLTDMLRLLNSFGCLVYSLGQIGKTLQNNLEGIKRFNSSFKGLCQRGKNFSVNSYHSMIQKMKQVLKKILDIILMRQKNGTRGANKIIDWTLRILFVVFAISLYPLAKKMLKA